MNRLYIRRAGVEFPENLKELYIINEGETSSKRRETYGLHYDTPDPEDLGYNYWMSYYISKYECTMELGLDEELFDKYFIEINFKDVWNAIYLAANDLKE